MPRTKNPEEFYWIDKFKNKILMKDMSPEHLQSAHTHVCFKELDLFNQINNFVELRDQLEQIAELRKIKLQDPDERFPKNDWGNYFCNKRKTHNIVPQPALLGSPKKLTVVNERILEVAETKEVGVTQPQYHDEESE